MKAYFVRHGQTNYNVLDLCNDDPAKNVYLTELGKNQAKEVGEKLKNIKIDLVFISELSRTEETARIITNGYKIPFCIDPRINDRKTGFESRPVSDFFEALKPDLFNLKFDNGESFREEKKRVFSFLKDLKGMNYNAILVVSHGEILQIINGYFNKLSDAEIWNTKIDNCRVLKFEI